jgi:hypothetical protein
MRIERLLQRQFSIFCKAGLVNEPSLLGGTKDCDDDALEGFDMLALN